jgi:putative NADH-flavin reductase
LKLLILGARGRTGGHLVDLALAQGHQVTGSTRDASRVTADREGLRWVEADSTDRASLESALADQEAVLCAIGPTSPTELFGTTLMQRTAPALIGAMQARRVKRLVMLSALGAGESFDVAPPVVRFTFRTLLRAVGKDKARAEQEIEASDLDYTFVYPPSLTNGEATNAYRHGAALRLRGVPKISRADVAEFMLAETVAPAYARSGVLIGP